MVNLAHSPLLRAGGPDAAAPGTPSTAERACADAARAQAATACTSILTHQVIDTKRRRPWELWECLEELRRITAAALEHVLTQVLGWRGEGG
jgi:hypothetical protein